MQSYIIQFQSQNLLNETRNLSAAYYKTDGDLVIFMGPAGHPVFTVHSNRLHSIDTVNEGKFTIFTEEELEKMGKQNNDREIRINNLVLENQNLRIEIEKLEKEMIPNPNKRKRK